MATFNNASKKATTTEEITSNLWSPENQPWEDDNLPWQDEETITTINSNFTNGNKAAPSAANGNKLNPSFANEAKA